MIAAKEHYSAIAFSFHSWERLFSRDTSSLPVPIDMNNWTAVHNGTVPIIDKHPQNIAPAKLE